MKKFVEIKPYVQREFHMIAEKVEARVNEIQESGHKVLSVSYSTFAGASTILYRKTIWRAFKDWISERQEIM